MKTQDKVTETLTNLMRHLKMDGLYIKNINSIIYKNEYKFEKFSLTLKRIFKSKQCILVGELTNKTIVNKLIDIYHVNLNKSDLLEQLINKTINPFDSYFSIENSNKKYIWSFKQDDKFNINNSTIQLYLMIYSLPGITLLKQGEEVGNGNVTNWDGSFNVSNKYGADLKLSMMDQNSFLNFIIQMNDKIKPKLNDDTDQLIKIRQTTTTTTLKPHGPEPHKNSYFSLSSFYLKDDYLNFNLTKSFFKITRQNNKRFKINHSLLSIKLYRNIIFLINLSSNDIFLDDLITLPVVNNDKLKDSYGTYAPQMPLHIMYDSSKLLPEYVDLDAPNSQPFYVLKSKNCIVLEY